MNESKILDLEKQISILLIQEDAETILTLMKDERDSVFNMEIIPYIALFIKSCQECFGELTIDEDTSSRIKDIRNFIKSYAERYSKTNSKIKSVDFKQDTLYKSKLKFKFLRKYNIHYNLGTYWTEDKHIIGNTHMLADFLAVENIFNPEVEQVMNNLGSKMGEYVITVKNSIDKIVKPPLINKNNTGIEIKWYYDLNTNKKNDLFDNFTKDTSLFFINITCNLNFVKYILRTFFNIDNKWIFRVEYIVTYYSYRAIERFINYCSSNDLNENMEDFSELFKNHKDLFRSDFRNCMMHHGLENRNVISVKYIDKAFYGIVENCYDGLDYYMFLKK